MNCPTCNTTLTTAERQGVEIDLCPQCRGVWLDRGELDKIIERYHAYEAHAVHSGASAREAYREHHHPKRTSFWHELFD